MKKKLRFLLSVIVPVICACSSGSLNSTVQSEPDAAAALFESAENFFKTNSHENALESYKRYLDLYPYGSKVDLALVRAATIYSEQKNHDAERMAYRRLIAEHPDSQFAADAMVEILVALYNEGKYKEVILQASEIINKNNSKTHLFRTYSILGDTYVSLGSPRDAIFFYHIAYQNAASSEEKTILFEIKTVVGQMSSEDTQSLLMRLDDAFLRSYLLYQLGVNKYENQNYKEALKIFSEFIENFPDHENARQAQVFIEKINRRFAFNRWRIGCLLPLSGAYEKFGRRVLSGIQFALDQYNSSHNQQGFKMIVKDTGSEPEIAIQSSRQLADNLVSIIIGPLITAEYAGQEAQIKGIPIITLTQQPGIPELGDYVFRIFLTPQMQIDAIVPYVIDQLEIDRFAVLYPDDQYGTTFMKLFRDAVSDYGATVVASESYEPDQTDFAAQIKKLSKSYNDGPDSVPNHSRQVNFRGKNRHIKSKVTLDFDAIFIPDVPEKIALIAPQLAFYDIDDVLLLGTNLWHSDKLIQMAGEYVQEAIMADVFYAEDSQKNVKEFIAGFEEFYGRSPGFIEALAYDAAMIAFQAASNPRVDSRKDIRDELQKLYNFEGVTGLTAFKENGDTVKQLYLLKVEDNKFVELNNPSRIQ
jgi:ABC-type branched-subunit amino acid transport system substrate-binding protein